MCVGPFAPKMPSAPKPPPPPPPPPTRDDPIINAEAEAKRRRILAQKGQASTILTTPEGDLSEANTGKKSLLGG
jgi:hypothetical protein